jgi:long-chain fatty acid transport protein
MKQTKHLLAVAVSMAIASPAAFATNGMNLEGYGPIATGMGGASMAYDNGTAGMMNNPATIGLAEEDGNRLDVAWGFLGPDVKASVPAMSLNWPSKSNAFNMPALGWTQKKGKLTIGAGAFAQGGMGTEYKAMGPGATFVAGGQSAFGGTPTAGLVSGWEEMSEVGVMRILFPVSYQVDDKLNIGGSIDFVRATMDLKMAMTGTMMWDMMPTSVNPGASHAAGTLSGTMINGLFDPALGVTDIYGAQFDFADSNPYDGATSGDGFAGKIGFTYKVNSKLTVGGTYHTQTSLGDLSGNAVANMAINATATGGDAVVPVRGKIKVKDFQWPQTMAVGLAFQATDKLMVAADIKQIRWSDVMKDFKMSFVASGNTGMTAGFNGANLDAVMHQNWDDQVVTQIGVSYQATNDLMLRAGANVAANPIPDSTLHYLFPAMVENHYTAGFGYEINKTDDVNFSATYAPDVSVTTSSGMKVSHGQTNWQLMYSHSF